MTPLRLQLLFMLLLLQLVGLVSFWLEDREALNFSVNSFCNMPCHREFTTGLLLTIPRFLFSEYREISWLICWKGCNSTASPSRPLSSSSSSSCCCFAWRLLISRLMGVLGSLLKQIIYYHYSIPTTSQPECVAPSCKRANPIHRAHSHRGDFSKSNAIQRVISQSIDPY